MVDFGVYVIVASIVWPNNVMTTYRPETRFDISACRTQAADINKRWREASIVGFATCVVKKD